MATVNPVKIFHGYEGQADLYEWASMNNGDVIGWLAVPPKADKTVHVYGAFGGTVSIEGTLESSPANPFVLNDSRGESNPMTFTAVDGRSVMEHVLFIRPNPGAGVANTTVRLLVVRGGG